MDATQLQWMRHCHVLLRFLRGQDRISIAFGLLLVSCYGWIIGQRLGLHEYKEAMGWFLIFLPSFFFSSLLPGILALKVASILGPYREGIPTTRPEIDRFIQHMDRALKLFATATRLRSRAIEICLLFYGLGLLYLLSSQQQWIGYLLGLSGIVLLIIKGETKEPKPPCKVFSDEFEPPTPWTPDSDQE